MSSIRIPLISYILRIGLGFAYISITILSFYSPEITLANMPSFIHSQSSLLPILIGVLSMCLAGWILSGKALLTSSSLSLCIVIAFLVGNIQKPFVIFIALQTVCLNIALLLCQRLEMKKSDTPNITSSTPQPVAPVVVSATPEEVLPTLH